MGDKNVELALYRIHQKSNLPLDDFKDVINNEMCMITTSLIGYFATMNASEDVLTMIGWSDAAMGNCSMIDKPIVYKLDETGLWGDAVRERKPVITNDYQNLQKPTKKGYPEGHVTVIRHMNLPVIENDKVVLVAGVGNKNSEYSSKDVEDLQAIMNETWKMLKPKL